VAVVFDVSGIFHDGFVTLKKILRFTDTPACRNICCTKRFSESRHYGVQVRDTPACRQAGTRARYFLGNLVGKANANKIKMFSSSEKHRINIIIAGCDILEYSTKFLFHWHSQ